MAARMLFRQPLGIRLFSYQLSVLRQGSARESTVSLSAPPNTDDIEQILEQRTQDLPVIDMANPYKKDKPLCVLCKFQIELNYKNTKLLSQFVSPFTGRLYSQSITGLCEKQYKRVGDCIEQARGCGFMPYIHKELAFLKDPQLCTSTTSAKKRRR